MRRLLSYLFMALAFIFWLCPCSRRAGKPQRGQLGGNHSRIFHGDRVRVCARWHRAEATAAAAEAWAAILRPVPASSSPSFSGWP